MRDGAGPGPRIRTCFGPYGVGSVVNAREVISQIVFAVKAETDCIDRKSEVWVCPRGRQSDVPFRDTTVPAGVECLPNKGCTVSVPLVSEVVPPVQASIRYLLVWQVSLYRSHGRTLNIPKSCPHLTFLVDNLLHEWPQRPCEYPIPRIVYHEWSLCKKPRRWMRHCTEKQGESIFISHRSGMMSKTQG